MDTKEGSAKNVTFSNLDFNKKLIESEPGPKRSKSWKKNSLKGIFRKMKSKTNSGGDLETATIEPEMQISSPILISSSSQSRIKQKSEPNAGSYSFSTQRVTLEDLSFSELESSQSSRVTSNGVQIINRVDGFFIPNQGHSSTDKQRGHHAPPEAVGTGKGCQYDNKRLVFKKSDPLAPDPFSFQTDKSSVQRTMDLEQSTKNGIEKLAKAIKWKRK